MASRDAAVSLGVEFAAAAATTVTATATAAGGAAANRSAEAKLSFSASFAIPDNPNKHFKLNPLDWAYRGEGSANIVMSYCGHDPSLKGTVLRVCKERPDSHHPGKEAVAGESLSGAGSAGAGLAKPEPVLRPEERELWGEVVPELATAPDRIELLHEYVARVMAPLIGEEFVEAGIAVKVSHSFLQQVADHIRPSRPAWRQAQGDVDLEIGDALLVTDLTHLYLRDEEWGAGEQAEKGNKEEGARAQNRNEQERDRDEEKGGGEEEGAELVGGSEGEGGKEGEGEGKSDASRNGVGQGSCCYNSATFCIELKPKTGFCPSSLFIAPANHVKTAVARFPMHQQLKLSQGEVAAASAYNPPLLFSSSPPVVLSALRTLLENPQNNLRVFADGRLLFGGHIHRHSEKKKRGKKGKDGGERMGGAEGEEGKVGKEGKEGKEEGSEKVQEGGGGVSGLAELREKEREVEAAGLAAVEAALRGFVCVQDEEDVNPSATSATSAAATAARSAAPASAGTDPSQPPSTDPHRSPPLPTAHLQHPRVDALLALVAECLIQSGALERLLAAQKLDTWDVEGGIHAYNEFMREFESSRSAAAAAAAGAAGAADSSVDGASAAAASTAASAAAAAIDGADGADGCLADIKRDCRKVLRDFLTAATAKDCGIMLALRAAMPGEDPEASRNLRSIVCPTSGCKYFYRLSIMDLDIKPLRKMPKYWSMDQQIVRHYCSVVSAGDSHDGMTNGAV